VRQVGYLQERHGKLCVLRHGIRQSQRFSVLSSACHS